MQPTEYGKPVEYAVAVVLGKSEEPKQFLSVRRPETKPDGTPDPIGGMWELPVVTMYDGELPDSAATRVGPEKLGTKIVTHRWLGVRRGERDDHVLYLMDFEADLLGDEPDVSKATTDSTVYAESKWTDDLSSLKESARH